MYWFSKYSVNHLRNYRSKLSRKILSESIIIVSIRPEIPPLLRDNLTLPFTLLLVFLDLHVFIDAVHKPTHTPYQFLSWGFSQIMLSGQADLKGLYSYVSKSPSISLNISQYLSEYIFRVSPSCMDIDNNESKGRGTLLHIIKWDPNTRVSFLNESIKLTGPKLDGITLHIKVSFLECTAIL